MNNKSDLKELAQVGAVDAYTQFIIYQTHGDEARYWDALPLFTLRAVVQGTDKSKNYLLCKDVYGYLIAEPQKSQSYITDVIKIMEILAKDVEDDSAYAHIEKLKNVLQQ